MLQPVTPPPTITTCARPGTVPLVVPGSIATMYLPGPPDQDIRARRCPGGRGSGGRAGRDQGRGTVPDWPHAEGPPFVIADGRPGARRPDEAQVRDATRAVYTTFIANGFIFASWAARIPQVRDGLGVTPGVLGLILLSIAVGSTIATPLSGLVIARLGDSRTVAVMSLIAAAGMATVAASYRYGIPPVAAGLFLFGFSSGTWDVAMNVQGAVVEQALGRAIMPRFHAGWSMGTVAGAGAGAAMVALDVPVGVHLLSLAVIGGYHTAAALGTLTFAVFLAAMTVGRWFGPAFIDRYGRVRVLRACTATALAGLLLIEAGGLLPTALAGAALM